MKTCNTCEFMHTIDADQYQCRINPPVVMWNSSGSPAARSLERKLGVNFPD